MEHVVFAEVIIALKRAAAIFVFGEREVVQAILVRL